MRGFLKSRGTQFAPSSAIRYYVWAMATTRSPSSSLGLKATTSPYNSRHGQVAAIRTVVYIIAQNYNLSRVDLWGEATRGGYGTRLFHGAFDQEEHCLDLIRHDYLTPILGTISQIFRIFRSAIKRYRCWEKKWASVH